MKTTANSTTADMVRKAKSGEGTLTFTPNKTTAAVPPSVASEYAKARRPSAVSQAVGDGYTKTGPMQKARAKPSSQFGLPKSGKKSITSKMG